MPQTLNQEQFCKELLKQYEGTSIYWHQLVYIAKYMVLVADIIQFDEKTLKIEFNAGSDVKDMGTALYDIHCRTNLATFATFNGCRMEVRTNG